MTALARYSQLALGKSVIEQHNILPDTKSPGIAVTGLFTYQSYFDDTLLEKALLAQSNNEPIVDTTMRQEQLGGYALALHPSSQTPIAVQPLVGGQPASSQAIVLRPGQVLRPYGRPDGVLPGNFGGFRWGLPFGWLGGGMATVYVLPSPDAEVTWDGASPEIIFHRQRMQIVAPASMPAATLKNWPMRFPWTQALRGATSIPQQGQAVIGVDPTRVLMSLRATDLAGTGAMRMVYQGTNDFDLDSTGAVIAGQQRFVDQAWGSYTALVGGVNLTSAYPVIELDGPETRMAADDGGLVLVDNTGGDLAGLYVDVVRYGRL